MAIVHHAHESVLPKIALQLLKHALDGSSHGCHCMWALHANMSDVNTSHALSIEHVAAPTAMNSCMKLVDMADHEAKMLMHVLAKPCMLHQALHVAVLYAVPTTESRHVYDRGPVYYGIDFHAPGSGWQ